VPFDQHGHVFFGSGGLQLGPLTNSAMSGIPHRAGAAQATEALTPTRSSSD
jgi:hypothetical protein